MGYFCNHRFIYLVIKRKYNNAAVSRLANVHFQDQVPGSRNTHTHTHTCSCLKLHINVPNMRQVSSHSAKEQIHATLMKFYHFLTLLTWRFRKDFDYCVFFLSLFFLIGFSVLAMSTEDRCSPTETTKWCLQGLWRSVCGVYGSFAASTLTDTPPPEFRPGQNMTCMYCSPPACCQHRCSATTQQNYKSCRWNYERARAVRRRHSPTANSSIKVTKFVRFFTLMKRQVGTN